MRRSAGDGPLNSPVRVATKPTLSGASCRLERSFNINILAKFSNNLVKIQEFAPATQIWPHLRVP
jgi:hypothetical protein